MKSQQLKLCSEATLSNPEFKLLKAIYENPAPKLGELGSLLWETKTRGWQGRTMVIANRLVAYGLVTRYEPTGTGWITFTPTDKGRQVVESNDLL